ncbi:uncharacterized protein LOC119549544 [Drosophila subpulchrella]|uniref:uncharacterized protein LOC119549544 n=1 Tax=Drosophila subpulchrella TaxID=1486046 RepID=UPI0018A1505D|nr:uncharacterized protein LOC119549544 [Drosophila subpulchrella]
MAEPDANGSPQDLLSQQETSPILALNDDCLERVLQKLGLQDQLRFARTCLRFRSIYKMATARLHKTVNTDDLGRCTTWEIRDFFKLSGAHVRGIKVRYMEEELAELVREKCINLRTLNFMFCPNIHIFMKSIMDNAYHLEALEICCSSLGDEDISVFQGLTNLKVFKLSESLITGSTLCELPTSIEVLKLDSLFLEVSYLPKTCKRLTKLRSLDLLRVERDDEVFKTMVMENSCPLLEALRFTMTFSRNSEYVAQLPSLKELVIGSSLFDCYGLDLLNSQERQLYSRLWNKVIDGLVAYKYQKLDHFTIGGRLTKEQLIQVGKLSALRVLCLSWVDIDCTPIAKLKMLEGIVFNEPCFSVSMVLHLFHACPKLHCLGLKVTDVNAMLVHGIADRVRQEMANNNMQRKLPIELGFFTSDEEIRMFICNNPEAVPKNIIKLNGYNDCCFWRVGGFDYDS